MNSGFPVGRIFGTEIRAHWTWIFLLALITVVFGEELSVQSSGGLSPAWAWGAAVVTAVLVFGSVMLHELAHVSIARRNGIGGNVVVVQLLGGTYMVEVRPRTWRLELKVALAGPLVSVGLVLAFGLIAVLLELGWGGSNNVPDAVAAVSFVSQILMLFNIFLAVTNMLPGFPMDGARVVHAVAWARSGREDVATRTASRVGRAVGIGIIALGAVVVVVVDLWPGLALMVAGWLLMGSSRMLDRRLMLQTLIAGARVSDAADEDTARIPAQLTLDVFAGEYLADRLGGVALVERGDELLGLIGTTQIRRIPRRNWPAMRTEQAMIPLVKVPWASGDSDLWAALETLERSGLDGLLIGSGGQVSAMLTRRSAGRLIRQLAERRALAARALFQAGGLPGLWTPPTAPPLPPATPEAPPTAPPLPPAAWEPNSEAPETDSEGVASAAEDAVPPATEPPVDPSSEDTTHLSGEK
jgi:Zn-dependent protease